MMYPCPVAGLYIRTRKYPEAVGMLLRFAAACDSTGAPVSQCKAYLGAVVVWLFANNGAQAWAVYQVRIPPTDLGRPACFIKRHSFSSAEAQVLSADHILLRCSAASRCSTTGAREHTHIASQCLSKKWPSSLNSTQGCRMLWKLMPLLRAKKLLRPRRFLMLTGVGQQKTFSCV
jgi:hypothetical protein